ncbi:GmrSD restriction endonuclease domain-containing protein [Helicobacter cetorum]|uniref:GmrSD restriction endonuclease domain-containing protein n=1 Tax=Helicobacter cetorum TaxID=138563 RepID=UPI00131558C4|nr:DUF1524 domain-containing protein [Helicobacter cetorum]
MRIIWYELDNDDKEQELFVRINTNKIPLTNAELIKALFLHAKNFEKSDAKKRQIEMAKEFDEMSYALEEENFYYFLSSNKKRITKIELLFEIFAYTQDKQLDLNDKYALYRYLAELKEQNPKDFLNLWSNQVNNTQESPKEQNKDKKNTNIKKIFLTLKSWYEYKELYHLIGFLVAIDNNQDKALKELYKKSLGITKTEFKKELYKRIKIELGFLNEKEKLDIQDSTSLKNQLNELRYNENKSQIEKILLFFNIATIVNNQQDNYYFDFKRYKALEWSIEHIYPQKNDGITHLALKEWLKDFIEYSEKLKIFEENDENFLKALKLLKELEEKGVYNKEKAKNLSDDDIKAIKDLLEDMRQIKKLAYDKEEFKEDNLHTLGNLTLLGKGDNSAFSNYVFMIKREMLKEKENHFIPLCSKNVFMKHYSKNLSNFWGNDDVESYFEAINKIISKALNLKEEENAK